MEETRFYQVFRPINIRGYNHLPKIAISCLLSLFLLAGPLCCLAESVTIRVAILDQLMSQKYSSATYEEDYLKGIQLAALLEKKRGFNVDYKYFEYKKTPLGILDVIPKVKAWAPDLIIGPRFSNQMLLLRNQINNILVVSPLASSEKLSTLPKNFYSFNLSDKELAQALALFTKIYLKSPPGIFSFVAEDCLSCTDISTHYLNDIKKIDPKADTQTHYFISTNVETFDIKNALTKYRTGYLIFTPNISYVSEMLISRITSNLNSPNLTFIGADGWGSHDITYIGKISTRHFFNAYHLQDWSLDLNSKEILRFKAAFYNAFGYTPMDHISYASFYTLTSILGTLNPKDLAKKPQKSRYVLNAFLKALNKKSLKQRYYVIYKYSEKKDTPVAIVDTKNMSIKEPD